MPPANDAAGKPTPPSLSELTARYLQRQVAAQGAGLANAETGEVVPFEAAPVQPVDARLAWEEALATVGFFKPDSETRSLQAPADWPALVAAQEPALAVPFCVG